MRAITIEQYGGPEVLQLSEQPDPASGPDGVVIRATGAGINPVDYKIRQGALDGAFPSAFPMVLGWDVAGVVEAVGPAVTTVAIGDPVWSYARKDHVQHGAYAELVRVAERDVAPAPASISLLHAAGVPLAGLTALQACDAVSVGPDDVVLVHAASGGVGGFAVQIARARGARVIGTASERNHDHLRSLGVEPVAYGEGLADRLRALDATPTVALDFVGGDSIDVSVELLADPSRIASVTDPQPVLDAGGRYVFVRPDGEGLRELAGLIESGRVIVDVDRVYPLAEAADAHRRLESHEGRGKIILQIGD